MEACLNHENDGIKVSWYYQVVVQQTLDLRKEKWTFLNRDLTVLNTVQLSIAQIIMRSYCLERIQKYVQNSLAPMLRISTEEENYQDFKTPPRSPSNKSNLSLDDARTQDSLSRTHSLKSPSKRKNDLRSSAIIRYTFILSKLELL